ncbi:MAG: PEP-CTERM sorting domain-containing protein [Verrucomicrobiales bacterium]|nr:PEP-CTERM sorting domain-containing protein [Verrucomicrobiales bacterium]
MLSQTVVANVSAQWTNTDTYNPSYTDTNNWAGGEINDILTGTNNAVAFGFNVSYLADSNVIYTGTFDATKLAVGDRLTGSGIPAGAYITAVNNAGQITISQAFTASGSGVLNVSGLGASNGYGTVQTNPVVGTFVVDAENPYSGTLTITSTHTVSGMGAKIRQNLRNNAAGMGAGDWIAEIIDEKTVRVDSPSNIPMSSTSGNFEFTSLNWMINATGAHTLSSDFIYRNTDPFNAVLAVDSGQSMNWLYQSSNPGGRSTVSLIVDRGGANRFLQYGDPGRSGVSDFDGQDVVFNVNPSGATTQDTLYFYNTGTNLRSLTKSGAGVVMVGGNMVAMNQNLYLDPGADAVVRVTDGVLTLASNNQVVDGARVRGANRYELVGRRATLYVDVTSVNGAQSDVVNLLEASAEIHLYGGELSFGGNGSSKLFSQSVGKVVLHEGRGAIGFQNGQVSNGFAVTLDSVTRVSPAATLSLFRVGTGDSKIFVTDDAKLMEDLVGGHGAADSANIDIIPWITGLTVYGQNWHQNAYYGTDLVTYTADGGFRILDKTTEYHAGINGAAADDNVKITASETFTGSGTINALVNAADNTTVTISGELVITSGVIINGQRSGFTLTGGTIDSGSNTFYISGQETQFTISSNLTNSVDDGNPGIVYTQSGANTVVNSSNNTYGGATFVQGNVLFGNRGALPATTDLHVNNGGRATLSALNLRVASLAGSGTVMFDSNGGNRSLNVGGGLNSAAERSIVVHNGGLLMPGDADGPSQAGTLTFSTGNNATNYQLLFEAGSILNLDLASDTLSDLLVATNGIWNLDFADEAVIRLNFLNDYTPDADTDWLLTAGFASLSGDLDNVLLQNFDGSADLGDAWSLSAINGNLLLSYSIPEPSVWLLLATGAGLLVLLRRRR